MSLTSYRAAPPRVMGAFRAFFRRAGGYRTSPAPCPPPEIRAFSGTSGPLSWAGAAGRGSAMFIGHYGPAFGAKAALRTIPLWVLFVAVQWMDVWWSIFVLTGVEKVRIEPGFTEASPLDLYYMPYTHGLIGALVLSAILGAIVALFYRGNRGAVFLVVAAAVFSHWILDLVVHMPDMPLWDNS